MLTRIRFVAAFAVLIVLAASGCAGAPGPSSLGPSSPDVSMSESASPEPSASQPEPSAPPAPSESDDAAFINQYSIDDPASIWVVVNKRRPFTPLDYTPADLVTPTVTNLNGQPLRAETSAAVSALFDAAAQAGYALAIRSGYRSYATQQGLYNGYVASSGAAEADRYSARPGYSEHQTGLAVDISAPAYGCTLSTCFGDTAPGQWLAANAWQYGFILRYPDGYEPVTGYMYEPWHFRYVGVELATRMHDEGVPTLEEFFGTGPAPGYGPE